MCWCWDVHIRDVLFFYILNIRDDFEVINLSYGEGLVQNQRDKIMSLDLISLTNVLDQANGSERGAAQKLAENQLKEWEVQPGFHYLLQVSDSLDIFRTITDPLSSLYIMTSLFLCRQDG